MERIEVSGCTGNLEPAFAYHSPRKLVIHTISFFRIAIHTILGTGKCCRFIPCCSAYAKEAANSYHWPHALFLVAARILRCHPFSQGGFDPVPSIGGDNHGL